MLIFHKQWCRTPRGHRRRWYPRELIHEYVAKIKRMHFHVSLLLPPLPFASLLNATVYNIHPLVDDGFLHIANHLFTPSTFLDHSLETYFLNFTYTCFFYNPILLLQNFFSCTVECLQNKKFQVKYKLKLILLTHRTEFCKSWRLQAQTIWNLNSWNEISERLIFAPEIL